MESPDTSQAKAEKYLGMWSMSRKAHAERKVASIVTAVEQR